MEIWFRSCIKKSLQIFKCEDNVVEYIIAKSHWTEKLASKTVTASIKQQDTGMEATAISALYHSAAELFIHFN